jgi:hypothetical protein
MSEKPIVSLFMLASVALPVAAKTGVVFIHSVTLPLQSCLAIGPHRGRYSGQGSIATHFRSSACAEPAMGTRPRGGSAPESCY